MPENSQEIERNYQKEDKPVEIQVDFGKSVKTKTTFSCSGDTDVEIPRNSGIARPKKTASEITRPNQKGGAW